MDRQQRRHPDDPDEFPEGPLDPWTGLPGIQRTSHITPMGQVEQYGMFADGLNRLRRGEDRTWRRALVPIGLGLVVVLLVPLVVGLAGRAPEPSDDASAAAVASVPAYVACDVSMQAASNGPTPSSVVVHATTGAALSALHLSLDPGNDPFVLPAGQQVLVVAAAAGDQTWLGVYQRDGQPVTSTDGTPVLESLPTSMVPDLTSLGPGTHEPVAGPDAICLPPSSA